MPACLHDAVRADLEAAANLGSQIEIEGANQQHRYYLVRPLVLGTFPSQEMLFESIRQSVMRLITKPRQSSGSQLPAENSLRKLEAILYDRSCHVLVPILVNEYPHLFMEATEKFREIGPHQLDHEPCLCFVLLSTHTLRDRRAGSPWLRGAEELIAVPGQLQSDNRIYQYLSQLPLLTQVDIRLLEDLIEVMQLSTGGWPDLIEQFCSSLLGKQSLEELRSWLEHLVESFHRSLQRPTELDQLLQLAFGHGFRPPDLQNLHIRDRFSYSQPERFAWEDHHDPYLKGVLGWDRGFAVPRSRLIELHLQAQHRSVPLNQPNVRLSSTLVSPVTPLVAHANNMQLTWLHIADLKIKHEIGLEQVHIALRNLLRDLTKKGQKADFLFIAGDIAGSGHPKDYFLAKGYLRELCQEGQIPIENVFMVPGNHDIDRNTQLGLERTLANITDIEKYFQPGSQRPHLVKLRAFIDFYNDFYSENILANSVRRTAAGMATSSATVVSASGLRIGVIPINTVWFSAGEDDSGKLFVGEAILRQELTRIQDATIRIALMHHPITDLSTLEQNPIMQRLHDSCHFVLHGRRHGATKSVTKIGDSQTIVFGSGTSLVHDVHRRDCALFVTVTVPSGTVTADVSPFPLCYERNVPDLWTLDTSVFPKAYPNYLQVLQIVLENKDRR